MRRVFKSYHNIYVFPWSHCGRPGAGKGAGRFQSRGQWSNPNPSRGRHLCEQHKGPACDQNLHTQPGTGAPALRGPHSTKNSHRHVFCKESGENKLHRSVNTHTHTRQPHAHTCPPNRIRSRKDCFLQNSERRDGEKDCGFVTGHNQCLSPLVAHSKPLTSQH